MGKSVNRVTLLGTLGKDPEVKYTPSGTAVANFSIATNERFKDKQSGEYKERTDWHNLVAWDRTAEIAGEYLRKGSKVYIEGRLETRSYDDKSTGAKKYVTEVRISELVLIDSRSNQAGTSAGMVPKSALTNGRNPATELPLNEDIPF